MELTTNDVLKINQDILDIVTKTLDERIQYMRKFVYSSSLQYDVNSYIKTRLMKLQSRLQKLADSIDAISENPSILASDIGNVIKDEATRTIRDVDTHIDHAIRSYSFNLIEMKESYFETLEQDPDILDFNLRLSRMGATTSVGTMPSVEEISISSIPDKTQPTTSNDQAIYDYLTKSR